MGYEGNDRYQFQPWHVKAYRWCRWMPACYVAGAWRIACWIATGAKPWDDVGRWQTACEAWDCGVSRAQYRMGYYYTTEEVIEELGGLDEPGIEGQDG